MAVCVQTLFAGDWPPILSEFLNPLSAIHLLLWDKKKTNPKSTLQLPGGWMRPGSFSSIVETKF
jgi:hypothetical protein